MRDYWPVASGHRLGFSYLVSPVEELRWLEYGQRLTTRHRNIAATEAQPSVAETLLAGVRGSAAQSCGFAEAALAADTVTLDGASPLLVGATPGDIADRWIFSGNRSVVDTVSVAGRDVVTGGRHRDGAAIAARFATAMRGLLAG